MKKYHEVWLRSHPHRDRAWLRDRLRDGFDVHHVDGDSGNDHPGNLALIEHTDHMRLHGMFGLCRLAGGNAYTAADERIGAQVYGLVADVGLTWREVRRLFWMGQNSLRGRARRWAAKSGYPWPIVRRVV